MKKIVLFIFVLISVNLVSQNTNSTCANAAPFCANGTSGLTFPAVTNAGAAQAGPNYGCLGSQPNPSWYYLQISTPGTLDILIQGTITTSPTGPGQDVDFICWGPFPSLAGICNSLTVGNTIDCSYSGSFTETLNIPNGQTGEYYLVLITNFANATQNILFQQYAGTGSTDCSLLANNSVICAGSNATVIANNSGNLTNPSYSIQPGGLSNANGTFVVTPATTTNYTVYVTGTNNVNAVVTQTAVSSVTVNPQPASVPTTTQATCTNTLSAFNLGLTFSPSSPVPGYTVNWSPIPNGITSTSQTFTSGAIAPGIYTATITAAGGCSTTSSFTMNGQPAIPVFTLIPFGTHFTVTCSQPTVTINASNPNYSYFWSNGTSPTVASTSADFTSLNLGTWSITATDPVSNCSATRVFTVSQNVALPSVTVTPLFQTITCSNSAVQTITATSSPTINMQHNISSPYGGVFSASSYTTIYSPGAPGIYTDTLKNLLNGCVSIKQFTVASGGGFPTFSVTSPQNFTLGCGTHSIISANIFSAQTTNSLSQPNGGVVTCTILAPGSSSVYSTSVTAISFNTITVPGTWTAVAVDPTSGCTTKVPFSVIQNTFGPQIEVAALTRTLSCFTPSVQLEGISTTPYTTYSWLTPSGNQTGSLLPVPSSTNVTNTLVANYVLTITDQNNACISTSLVPVYQNLAPPIVAIAASTRSLTCKTPTITLANNSHTNTNSNFPSSGVVQAILWQGPPPQDNVQISTTYVGAVQGIYTLTGKDASNGCTAVGTYTLIDYKIFPVVNNPIEPPPFFLDCGSSSVAITPIVTDPTSKFEYLWDVPPTSTISAITNSVLNVNLPGTYKIKVTNGDNGCSSNALVSVIIGTLTANFSPDKISGYAPLTVNFSNNSASSSSAAATTSINTIWNFGNGTNSVTPSASISPTAVYNQPGTYTITAYTNKGACQSTSTKTVVVDIPSKLEIPNVFTPNGDGSNDLFFVRASNLTEITALIYDRWGHKIYELTSNTGNIAWDGKNQVGNDVAEGTYFYIITAKGKDGKDYNSKGTVNLYR